MDYDLQDALVDAAALHSHPLFIVDCDAKRDCPECRRNAALLPLLCLPGTCGSSDGKSIHVALRGHQFTGVADAILTRKDILAARQAPQVDDLERVEMAASSRPPAVGSSPRRLF